MSGSWELIHRGDARQRHSREENMNDGPENETHCRPLLPNRGSDKSTCLFKRGLTCSRSCPFFFLIFCYFSSKKLPSPQFSPQAKVVAARNKGRQHKSLASLAAHASHKRRAQRSFAKDLVTGTRPLKRRPRKKGHGSDLAI